MNYYYMCERVKMLHAMSRTFLCHKFVFDQWKVLPGKPLTRCLSSVKFAAPLPTRPTQHNTTTSAVGPSAESIENSPDLPKLSAEELDEMFKKRLYNTETWRHVINRQKEKFKRRRRRPDLNPDMKSFDLRQRPKTFKDGPVSYAAQSLLEDSGWWRGELNTESSEMAGLMSKNAELAKGIKYPFAMVKPTNQILTPGIKELEKYVSSEGDEHMPEDSSTDSLLELEESMRDLSETLNGLDESIALAEDVKLSPLNPNFVETIELADPYQMEISKRTVERVKQFKQKALYGSPNPSIPSTKMPCGGCGAILHCQDSAIPGYLPSEMLMNLTQLELQDTICQRCAYLKEYDVVLNVSVSPKDYIRVISEIGDKNALVLLMVDLLDFPCSIWPGIIDIIGPKRPIVIVGNKVDLLPKDKAGYLERIKLNLEQSIKNAGVDTGSNIKHTCLISAKTGYGIEELITKIQHSWGIKGDIYIIGCTNVGKSSLFNALLQSDLCKSQAVDLFQRATVSAWPGTTLNLLKFPLLNPTPWRTYLRVQRLQKASYELLQERRLRSQRLKDTRNPTYATLIGKIDMTFKNNRLKELEASANDPFKMSLSMVSDLPLRRLKKIRDDDPAFASGKWFYDTPGAVHQDQIIGLLTLEELSVTIPRSLIEPRCFIVKPGQTFFLAGLGRIDYVEGESSASFMLYSSSMLPVSIMAIEHADEFYEKYLGTDVMKVPFGGLERLKDFPALKSKEISFIGTSIKECCGDIVLSSAGWVSINMKSNAVAKFLAYTPDGRGCYIRVPSLFKFGITARGRRIIMTPFCYPSKIVD